MSDKLIVGVNKAMMNADMKVEVAAAMKSYLTSQDFKDIIAKAKL